MTNLHDDALGLTNYAVYPNVGNNLAYAVLGFVDELFGEYISEFTNNNHYRMKEEICDVFWYLNQASFELSTLYGSAFERHLSWAGNEVYFADVTKATGVIAGIAKKIMRDGQQSAYKKQDAALRSLGVMRDFVFTQFDNLDMTVEEVVEYLHEKLGSRQERGVLKGDGDHR